MSSRALVRNALVGWIASTGLVIAALWNATRSDDPSHWLVPLATALNAGLWFALWRRRRRIHDGTLDLRGRRTTGRQVDA